MKKTLKILFVIFFVFPFVIGVIKSLTSSNGEGKSQNQNKDETERTLSQSDFEKVYLPMTKKAYPKAHKKWGDDGFHKINALAYDAAKLAYQSKRCDEIIDVSLSDNQSKPKSRIVFFVDCKNKERFYISENDIKSKLTVQSVKEKFEKIDQYEYYRYCLDMVKKRANFPATVDSSIFNKIVRPSVTGDIVVQLEFSAKNAFGVEGKYNAECSFYEHNRTADIKITEIK